MKNMITAKAQADLENKMKAFEKVQEEKVEQSLDVGAVKNVCGEACQQQAHQDQEDQLYFVRIVYLLCLYILEALLFVHLFFAHLLYVHSTLCTYTDFSDALGHLIH